MDNSLRLCRIIMDLIWQNGVRFHDLRILTTFVWAVVGPALESYSTYDEVRRMEGSPFTVSEFLREVRRMVADFALGQILKGQSTEGLDEWTRYYLIHRNLFGLADAPVGECILLSQGYGLDLNELRSPRGFMLKASSGDVRLAKWDERKRDDLEEPHPGGGLPMIDSLQRLLWLWSAGDTAKLRTYAADRGRGLVCPTRLPAQAPWQSIQSDTWRCPCRCAACQPG
jgi:putative DNA methylase